jgi:dTDP-4-dehydrorhamnose 3,5-epimerase-like enzyme
MEFKLEQTGVRDLLIIIPEIFKDDRGFFTKLRVNFFNYGKPQYS